MPEQRYSQKKLSNYLQILVFIYFSAEAAERREGPAGPGSYLYDCSILLLPLFTCSQRNVMNACRIFYSVLVINQPKKANIKQYQVDKIYVGGVLHKKRFIVGK
jgi:hypothetical protein